MRPWCPRTVYSWQMSWETIDRVCNAHIHTHIHLVEEYRVCKWHNFVCKLWMYVHTVCLYVCMLVTYAITPSVRRSDFKQWNIVRYCPICIRCFKVSKGVMNRSCDTEAPVVKTFNDEWHTNRDNGSSDSSCGSIVVNLNLQKNMTIIVVVVVVVVEVVVL